MTDTGAYMKDDDAPKVKKRRITKEDWSKIESFITKELDKRKGSQFRKKHELIWTEIDRQTKMDPMKRVTAAGEKAPVTWHSVLELGELSKASEIICADVRRITFPQDRFWLEAHIEIPPQMTPQGPTGADPKKQSIVDGTLRSFMTQQHLDFGFKARVDLSIKEALHHGSFVAEVEWQQHMLAYEGKDLKMMGAPVWVPHSMWNCWPDESPSVEPTSMYYTGSMLLRKFQPLYKIKQMKGEGWMPSQYHKIKKQDNKNGEIETSDVEMIVYYGDINIDRADGDIYLPNSKVILANGTVVYYAANELPYPSVIYGGYERQDPRDPYYTSPLIKQSPIQKVATVCANKYLESLALKVEPPIGYDGNDPTWAGDGPVIEPGAKFPTKTGAKIEALDVGDPSAALAGLEMCLRAMQEGTGVSAVRSGVANSDRQTATEVQKVAQGAEVRTIDFIDKLNSHLRSYLHMQHQLNLKHCERYSFYNSEMGTADFIRITKKDIPESVSFDVVGSKGLLGEEQRANRTANVVAFASGNPLFAPLLKPVEILTEMFQDAGNKNPERLLQQEKPQIPPEVQQQMAQMQQALQETQAKLQDAEKKLGDKSQQMQIDAAKAQQDIQQGAQTHQQDMTISAEEHQQKMMQDRALFELTARQKAAEGRQKLEQKQ